MQFLSHSLLTLSASSRGSISVKATLFLFRGRTGLVHFSSNILVIYPQLIWTRPYLNKQMLQHNDALAYLTLAYITGLVNICLSTLRLFTDSRGASTPENCTTLPHPTPPPLNTLFSVEREGSVTCKQCSTSYRTTAGTLRPKETTRRPRVKIEPTSSHTFTGRQTRLALLRPTTSVYYWSTNENLTNLHIFFYSQMGLSIPHQAKPFIPRESRRKLVFLALTLILSFAWTETNDFGNFRKLLIDADTLSRKP